VLVELRIRDFAIIDSLTITFAPGFNVLTGETGAGKSIIVGALSVLVGERASTDTIRDDADKAVVEGVFDVRERDDIHAALDARGIDSDGDIVVLRREISRTRTRAWANSRPVTAAVLSELGRLLVNIHGQHEAQTLLDPNAQRNILDSFADAEGQSFAVLDAHATLIRLEDEYGERERKRASAREREDWLRHVVREIDEARLTPSEDDTLALEMRRLTHAVDLRRLASEAVAVLEGETQSVIPLLGTLQRTLAALGRMDSSVGRLQEAYDSAYYQLQELSRDLANYADAIEADPSRLATIERRRDLIHDIARKYGGSVERALEQCESARAELALLDGADQRAGDLAQRVATARTELTDAAVRLTVRRRQAARLLEREVEAMLPSIGLPDGRFLVTLQALPEVSSDGAESVEFAVALNVGYAERPLARVASGGELSRVMLAIKTILARLDRVPTLVFDEVDVGIGGTVAMQVGEALRRVAQHHQVFVITHLAQIAARAHHHIVVRKDARSGVTTADVAVVSEDARVREVARMLGGDPDSEVGRAHASELLTAAAVSPAGPTAARKRGAPPGRR
jgi:DNA repair protein RecN (Recombination protein N)